MTKRHRFHAGPPRPLRWERGLPRLVLSARWQRPVRWGLHSITAIAVGVALLGLSPLPGFAVAVALVSVDWFLGRSIFRFAAIHVTPLPDFEYDASQWTSMAYMFEGPPPTGNPVAICFVFRDASYAAKFFSLLRAWNFGERIDRDDNIVLSAIIDEDHYWVYLYPNFQRETVRSSWRSLRGKARRAGQNQEPFLLVMSLVICHDFSTMAGFSIGYFADRYKNGQPIDLLPLVEQPGQEPVPAFGVEPITKFRVKIKARADLAPDEFEATHLAKTGR